MSGRFFRKFWDRLENRVFLIVLLTTCATSVVVYTVLYRQFYGSVLDMVRARTVIVNQYAQRVVPEESFRTLNSPEDKEKNVYREVQGTLNAIRQIAAVRYLYTAKLNEKGEPVYVIDGLDPGAEDFRSIGDLIEPEIQEVLAKCLAGNIVDSKDILNTEWGAIFITCWPVKDSEQRPVGAVVMEFDAQSVQDRINALKLYSGLLSLGVCILFIFFSKLALNRVSEPFYKKLAYTDPMTSLNNRTAFEHDLEQHELYMESGQRRSVVVYDLNDLKRINDTFGHAAGDAYIRRMADALSATALSALGDAYRIGGDEFASIVIGKDPSEVDAVLERVHSEACREDEGAGFFSFAYGAAHFDPARDKSLRDTFRRADKNMYIFKRRSGRARLSASATPTC